MLLVILIPGLIRNLPCILENICDFFLIVLQGFAPHCLSPSAKRSVALLRCFQICLDTPLWKTHIKFLQHSSVMFSAPRMQCTICVALCIQFAMKVLGLIRVKVTVMVSLDLIDGMLRGFLFEILVLVLYADLNLLCFTYNMYIIKMPCLKFTQNF